MTEKAVNRKNLSLERLLNFAAVARKHGIAAATGADASRQALVSRQIGELASHFEVELTRRSGRGIEITPAGKKLARLVNELETGLDELRAEVKATPMAYSLAASNSVLHWLLLPKLSEINQAVPAVKWTLHHESTAGITEKVTMGQIDFGVCLAPPTQASCRRRWLGTVAYSLFTPPGLTGPTDTAEALRAFPLALPVGGALRESLETWAKKGKITLNTRLEVDSYVLAANAVARGTHAAVLPSLAASSLPKGTRSLPLPASVAQPRKLWLIWTDRLLRTRDAADGIRDELVRRLGT